MRMVFGHVSLSAHMLLLGKVVNCPADFAFCWPLICAVLTNDLWRYRNAVIFQHEEKDITATVLMGVGHYSSPCSWESIQGKLVDESVERQAEGYCL